MAIDVFRQIVVDNWGDRGEAWLAGLPALIDEVAARWGLEVVGTPYEMSFHWVGRVITSGGVPAVLKLGVPDEHVVREIEALRLFDGDGAVRLLDADLTQGALLLEAADPGTPVAALPDDRAATALLIEAGRRLHRVPPDKSGLPHLGELAKDFAEPVDGPLPRRLIQKAAELFDHLLATSPGDRVLHGDLHHGNVLRTKTGWAAIDPHGRIGDPGFDCGAMFYNPDRERGLKNLDARIDQLSDALPRERVIQWGFVMSVLSDVWNAPRTTQALEIALLLDRRT